MSLAVIRAAARAELSDDYHAGRLLLLLQAAGGRQAKPVAGIMKLAKMDFLLRYPNCLLRALRARGRDTDAAAVQPHEEQTIETKMIRFRYGPWDPRYRRWIGILVSRGLARTYRDGNTVYVGLTANGQSTSTALASREEFSDYVRRADLISRAVGAMSGTQLKRFIYEQFPELSSMRWGEEIEL